MCRFSGTLQDKSAFGQLPAVIIVERMESLWCTMLRIRNRSIMLNNGSMRLIGSAVYSDNMR